MVPVLRVLKVPAWLGVFKDTLFPCMEQNLNSGKFDRASMIHRLCLWQPIFQQVFVAHLNIPAPQQSEQNGTGSSKAVYKGRLSVHMLRPHWSCWDPGKSPSWNHQLFRKPSRVLWNSAYESTISWDPRCFHQLCFIRTFLKSSNHRSVYCWAMPQLQFLTVWRTSGFIVIMLESIHA